MKIFLSIVLSFFSVCFSVSQVTDSVEWEVKSEFNIGKEDVWSVDILGNVYSTDDRIINKHDSIGKKKFSQSIKAFGHLKDIQTINTMKVVGFSEEQQAVCLLDNTLTLSEECIDLSKFDIGNASHIAVSGQSDKLWVVDQLNSRLLLLSLGNTYQYQEIKNLQGILNIAEVLAIKEVNNQLFLADTKGKIYQFDLYGSLLNVYESTLFIDFILKDETLILLAEGQLILLNMMTNEEKMLNLPMKDVLEVQLSGNFFYFRTENKILKYTLILHD